MMSHVFPFAQFGSFVICYLDDILVFSQTKEEHLCHLERVLTRLEELKLFIKRSKCTFGQREIDFVGQLVGNGKRRICPRKADLIRHYPTPKNYHDICAFYGLVNYCREFLPNLLSVSTPLTDLTKNWAKFEWNDHHQQVFETIKELVANAIELTIPDPDRSFVLQTDASDVGLGATLLQPNDSRVLIPVELASRKLNVHERNYPTHEKELLAIVWGLQEFRHHIEGLTIPLYISSIVSHIYPGAWRVGSRHFSNSI
jgi:hypothetical protein